MSTFEFLSLLISFGMLVIAFLDFTNKDKDQDS
ncbi:putative holin-like toxin [Mesobacillus maritimus]